MSQLREITLFIVTPSWNGPSRVSVHSGAGMGSFRAGRPAKLEYARATANPRPSNRSDGTASIAVKASSWVALELCSARRRAASSVMSVNWATAKLRSTTGPWPGTIVSAEPISDSS